jgi:hypothetical protein
VTAPAKRVWFLDTASLLSMAVDAEIGNAVLDEIANDPVVIIDIVHDELTRRASIASTATLAQAALSSMRPQWTIMQTERYVSLEEVQQAQEDVADGRTLLDEQQHWAESTIIALGRQSAEAGYTSVKLLLSEDYDARRVASTVPNMRGLSIHTILHHRVHAQKITAELAAQLAAKLHDAARGPQVTAEDFADKTGRGLGRVAKP